MSLIPTLREFASGRCVDLDLQSALEMDVLWAQYADQVHRDVQVAGAAAAKRDVFIDTTALEILTSIMGTEWTQDRIINFATCDSSQNYLDLGDHIAQIALRRFRIRELARRLYEFQSFEWFPVVVSALRTGDVGSVAFELDTLSLLLIASLSAGTRAEVSEKGKDFDCFALMRDVMVPVEVKAKSDQTPWTTNTVRNTVRAAARQLPKGEVGVLFIRVPFLWVGPELEAEFSETLMEGTRQTTRLGAIVTVIDKPSLVRGDPVTRVLDYFREPECPDHIWEFCMRLRQLWDADLTYLAPRAPF